MELYGIVGAVEKKETPSGRAIFEVVLYWLDYKIKDRDGNEKNKPVQIAFWENSSDFDKLPERIKKGNRLRITVDRIVENATINNSGNPVSYLNANGLAFVYDNRGTGSSNSSNSGNNQNRSGGNNQNNQQNSNNQSQNRNQNNQNRNQNQNQNQNQGRNNQSQSYGASNNQGNNQNQTQNVQQSSNQSNQYENTGGGLATQQKEQINDIESFLSSI